MNVFIDTNILLKFYHFTSDELEALESVFISQRKGKVNLCITSQVIDEFNRNREGKLKDALRRFNEIKIAPQLPSFMQEFEEYEEVLELSKKIKKKLNKLSESSHELIGKSELDADLLISRILQRCDVLSLDEETLNAAKYRTDKGSPPGKKGSLGDAINWELLLRDVTDGEDLFIISEDGDFYSSLYEDQVSQYLKSEWASRKNSEVRAYRQLRPFMKEHHDGDYLSFDKEKLTLILELAESGSFAQTHKIVRKLEKYKNFSLREANLLFEAAKTNSQVGGIATDYDVCDLLLLAGDKHIKEFDDYAKKLVAEMKQSVDERN